MAASVPVEKTIYLGAFAHCVALAELEIVEKGAIGVDEHGVIGFIEKEVDVEDVRKRHEGWNDAKVVSVKDGFFFPGFIDTHTHAPQHPNTGLFGKTTLLDWLDKYTFPMESSFSSLDKASRIYTNFVSRTLSHGTTTCAYYATRHVEATNLLADICLARGQRALVGRVCMDTLSPEYYRDESVESAVRDSKACIDYVRSIDAEGSIVRPIITPRFAPSCTAPCLAGLGKLAHEADAFVQTHVSENTSEIALVEELFPDSKSYTHVYDEASLLTPKTILAHAIHLSTEERKLVKERGSKISHCPASNTALTSGCCPVRELLDEGITIGLGTDVSGGFSPSILEEARHAIWTSRFVAMGTPAAAASSLNNAAKLSTAEALYLATRGGAAVVGLEDKVGGFEVGKEFDAQMIRLGSVPEEGDKEGVFGEDGAGGPVDLFGFESAEEKLEKWMYSGDDRNCVAVWVRGRLVHKTTRYTA
ncbi:guanine deaminase [Paraphaeosphaeria sporulosa]|uniref:Guanine deaminase n=1 Tax=Paraphaeosphaeria sporulosa TaxID=1460663 RepID=A0A177CKI0_9PLEO|nr:guanine deaminase [Paraphaeosphaeria sporulosa]OAG08044.1 guanine deaminase [Paraphaeosphaeria sporulosa]